jgi:hypothetical protein
MLRKLPVPDAVFTLTNRIRPLMTEDELIGTDLGDLIIRLGDFRAAVENGTIPDTDQAMSVLYQMDLDLENWSILLPTSWRYGIHACPPQDGFYTTYYHSYAGFSIAAMWNQYRIARCIVNDLLLTYLDLSYPSDLVFDDSLLPDQSDHLQHNIRAICTDICVSVPYFLRQTSKSDGPRPGIGALEIMWALDSCASMRCVPEEQRIWAVAQLDQIGHEMGVHQALPLARMAK